MICPPAPSLKPIRGISLRRLHLLAFAARHFLNQRMHATDRLQGGCCRSSKRGGVTANLPARHRAGGSSASLGVRPPLPHDLDDLMRRAGRRWEPRTDEADPNAHCR